MGAFVSLPPDPNDPQQQLRRLAAVPSATPALPNLLPFLNSGLAAKPALAAMPAAQGIGSGISVLPPQTSNGPLAFPRLRVTSQAAPDLAKVPNLGGNGPMPDLGTAPAPNVGLSASAPASRLGVDQAELQRLQSTGSGASQIKEPWLRGFAKVGDALLETVAPRVAQYTGGTEAHHQLLMGQAQQRIGQDQTQLQSAATLADSQAQAVQRQALATQEQAKATALTTPKPTDGQLLFDGEKNPIGYMDGAGQYYGPHDPNLPAGVSDVLAASSGRQPKDEFQLWQKQNPDKPVSDFFALKASNAPDKQNKDDKAIAIMAKPPNQRSPDETSYLHGYDQYVQKNKIAPAAVRVSAMMQMPQAVVDPHDPSREIYTTKRGAIGMEASGSGEAAAARRMDGYMTSGAGGTTLNAGQTLTHHVDLYDKAVDAVHNGDSPALNAIGNQLGIQLGNNAQTNLNLIRQGVAMEAARFYTGGVPGEHEIDQFNKSLSGDGSPAQMHGGASTVRAMANGKMQSLQAQYRAGSKGQPNFGNGSSPAPSGVRMQAPDGSIQMVDPAHVSHYTQLGAKVVK